MSTPVSDEAAEIVRQMARVRYELHDEVEEMVDNARALTDWRWYVKSFPWACIAGAAAVGFLVVPRRLEVMRPDSDTIAKLAKNNQLVVKQQGQAQPRRGMAGSLFGFAASLALRSAFNLAGQKMGEFFRPEESPGIDSPTE